MVSGGRVTSEHRPLDLSEESLLLCVLLYSKPCVRAHDGHKALGTSGRKDHVGAGERASFPFHQAVWSQPSVVKGLGFEFNKPHRFREPDIGFMV